MSATFDAVDHTTLTPVKHVADDLERPVQVLLAIRNLYRASCRKMQHYITQLQHLGKDALYQANMES